MEIREAERILHTLDELFRNELRHSEFLSSVFSCLKSLERLGDETTQYDDALRGGIDLLSRFYVMSPPWVQGQIIDGLRRSHSWVLITMFINQFHHYRNGVSVPRHILLDAAFDAQFEVNNNIPYAMAFGDNNSFNLGIAADGFVRDAKLVPVIGVTKVSMADAHTLFLTRSGEVFACGCGMNFKMGTNNDKVVVTPIKITFPGEQVPIVDIAAGHQHSVFISEKYIYVCGVNSEHCIGVACKERGPQKLKRIKLESRESRERLKEVVTCDHFTVVSGSSTMWVAGRMGEKIYAEFTKLPKNPDIFHGVDTSSVNSPHIITYGTWNTEEGFNSFRTHSRVMSVQTATLPVDCRKLEAVKVHLTLNEDDCCIFFRIQGNKYHHPCLVTINGLLLKITVKQFHVTENGLITVLGKSTISGGTMPCNIYRGALRLIEETMDCKNFQTIDKGSKFEYHNFRVLIVLQEVPGAHSVQSLACSPDGRNTIYIVNGTCKVARPLYRWESTQVDNLNIARLQFGLEPLELDLKVENRSDPDPKNWKSFLTFREWARIRIPSVDTFIKDGCLILNELSNNWNGLESECVMIIANYINGMDSFWRNDDQISALRKFANSLGINVIREGPVYDGDRYILEPKTKSIESLTIEKNCTLISIEGSEIEFSTQILELHSSYFGIAMNYQNDLERPSFKVNASADVIRKALLAICHPQSLFSLEFDELFHVLKFLDQYLLHSTVEDCVLVLFEKANEFNVDAIFELYNSFPHLRELLVKHLSDRIHLALFWRNSTSVPIQLLRDVSIEMIQSDHTITPIKPGYVTSNPMFMGGCYVPLREAVVDISSESDPFPLNWGRYRKEHVLDVLLGSQREPWMELELLRQLREAEANACNSQYNPYINEDSKDQNIIVEPSLLKRVKLRIAERELISTTPSRRNRRKSNRSSMSEKFDSSKKLVEEHSNEIEARTENSCHSSNSEDVMMSQLGDQQVKSIEIKNHGSNNVSDTYISCGKPPGNQTALENKLLFLPNKTGRNFFSKHAKFQCANQLLQQGSTTHLAPWAGLESEKTSGVSLSDIIQEEVIRCTQEKKDIQSSTRKTINLPHKIPNVGWAGINSPVSSLIEIMKEEQKKIDEDDHHLLRPLKCIETEERAIQELRQLYMETAGDDVIVNVERVTVEWAEPHWSNVYSRR